MNRLSSILAFVAGVGFGVLAADAAEPASNYEQLKVLEPFLGPWVYDGPLLNDAPGIGEKGTKVWAPRTHKWLLNKNALIVNASVRIAGKPPLDGVELIGWDPKEGKIVSGGFTSAGFYSHGVWTVDGKTATIRSQGVEADGTETSATILVRVTDRGTMVWKLTRQMRGGKELPDSPEYEFKPLKPAQDGGALTSEDFRQYGEIMVGQWEGEIILAGDVPGVGKNGEKVKGRASIEWALDKKGLDWNWQFGAASGKGFTAWDPASKRIINRGFDSRGALDHGSTVKEGGKWVSRGTTVFPDGTTRTLTDTLIVEDAGNTHIHVGTDVLLNGVKQPGYRDVWKRVTK
ncbi:MAG: hypothetical protein NUV77_10030 [Thermoguttaceae bacterium]|jgi:hypothetical protein|nr:hypothetical protein [Thermoguttaceae bacterium]